MPPGDPRRPKLFRLPTARHRLRRDIERELRFHLEGRIEELVARGYTRAQAEQEAWERFGDLATVRDACEEIDAMTQRRREWSEWRDALGRDARYATRGLVRRPGFSAVVIATLALGLGATTAIYTLLDAVVLRPLPYHEPDRLVQIQHPVPGVGENDRWLMSVAGYFYFRTHARSLADLAVFTRGEMNLVTGSSAERARVGIVSASLFDVFGARAILGRPMTADDNLREAAPVAMLSYEFWQRRFGGDTRAVGQTINLQSTPYQIIGVSPPGFTLPDHQVDLWVPHELDPGAPPVNSHYLNAIARLRPEVTVAAAQAELARLTSRLPEALPQAYGGGFMERSRFGVSLTPLRDIVIGGIARTLWVLLGAVAIVLLIACANVANLFLVRSEARRREVAIRTALGADRTRLAGHYLTESLLLSLLGGALAVALAYWAMRALVVLNPDSIPRLAELTFGWRPALIAALLALGAGLVFGTLPLTRLAVSGVDVSTLREGGRGQTASRRQHAVRGALVVGQMALALLLLAAAGLMLRSFQRLRDVHPGFESARVLAFDLSLPWSRYGGGGIRGPERYRPAFRFYQELGRRVAALPDVESVGMTQSLPLRSGSGCSLVFVADRDPAESEAPCLGSTLAGPGYFATMGIPVSGRAPGWSDMSPRHGEVVVSRAFADRFWPGQDAIGKRLRPNGSGEPYYTVVGVAGDVHQVALDQTPREIVYYPMIPLEGAPLWMPPLQASVVARTRSDNPLALAPAIRRIMTEMDREVPIANVETMDAVVAHSTARTTFSMLLLAIAGTMALILSAVGIYGVISYIVSQRRPEIGVRMALGAQAAQVRHMIVMQSVRLAALGIAIGLAGALATTHVMQSLLYEVSPTDPITLTGATVLLVMLAALASWVPARRAAKVDPVEALRTD